MSGRALRRLPVLALARYIGIGHVSFPSHPTGTTRSNTLLVNGHETPRNSSVGMGGGADVETWLDGMEKVVKDNGKELERLI